MMSSPFSLALLAAVILVIVVRRIWRLPGAVLGVALTIALAVGGYLTYENHGGLAFFGHPLSRAGFLGFVALWLAIEVAELVQLLRHRRDAARSDQQIDQP